MSTVTITDVAKRVGVSVATISRYLSGFTVRNQEQIREAIIELNYRPSAAARNLKSGRTGIIAIVVALIGSTTATLLQKRVGADIPLVAGTAYQYLFTGLVLGVIALATGNSHITWSSRFTAAFVWLVVVLSVGAILLLLWLLNSGSAASVSSLLYLVPPATAIEAFFLFGEKVNTQGFLGIGITALGVWLVIRG